MEPTRAKEPRSQPANVPTCQRANLPTCQPANLPTCQPANPGAVAARLALLAVRLALEGIWRRAGTQRFALKVQAWWTPRPAMTLPGHCPRD
jgi:hypothetical protein